MARPLFVAGLGRLAPVHPDAKHGLVHDAVVGALQPVIPPAQRLLQEARVRSGRRLVRILVAPRADQRLAGHRQAGQQARHRIGVGVGPAADGEDGTFDGRIVLADRAVFPEFVAALVLQPVHDPWPGGVEPRLPDVAPGLADQLRIGRTDKGRKHGEGPVGVLAQETAAHVVDVVGIAVVGGVDRDDALERRRPARRDLQRVEAAPGLAHHADIAGAPGLTGDPGDHLERVVVLLLEILVQQHALGFAAAPQVHPDGGVAMTGRVGMHGLVARRGAVALAIGDVFQDGRDGGLAGIFGQPGARGQAGTVREGNPGVLDLANLARQLIDHTRFG